MSDPLPIVDATELPPEYRTLLRPGETLIDAQGRSHELPRYYYELASWEQAKTTKLTVHFSFAELMGVDCREADLLLRKFPHYVPCAVSVLARYLEEFRSRVEAPIHVSINGGYRSPAHRFADVVSPHLWAGAADIYRIGEQYLDNQKAVERYTHIAETIGQEVYLAPWGHGPGATDDHLHFDLGYLHVVPRSFRGGA